MKDESVLAEFDIEFVKLKDGIHSFSYVLDNAFFEACGYPLAGVSRVNADLKFEKQLHFFQLHLSVEGELTLSCDRCLEPLPYPVQAGHDVMVKQKVLGERESALNVLEEDDDLIVIAHTAIAFNVAPLFYDLCVLSLPLIRNCDELPVKPCNQEMLKKLAELSGASEPEMKNDPRWDGLKDLFKEQ